ncbi:MAG: alpha/beta hydrolase family protein [Gaiellaceae bacterium]
MRSLFAAALVALSLVVPGTALAAVKAGQPFPSNLFTTSDRTQVTGLRVDLPKPDCTMRPSDCADIDVLNTLDGFNIQPRISIPFSGPIDVTTVSSQSVFLIGPQGRRVGINQVVWEPAANTLHVESDEQLEAHSKYLLVVTRGVRGSDGQSLDGSAFWRELFARGPAADKAYRTQLLFALGASFLAGADPAQVAAASLFTTQSIDAISKKVRRQIRKGQAPAPTFALGTGGERTVFPLSSITAIQWTRQTGTSTFATSFLPTPALSVFPGSVGTVAFGSYASPDYEAAAKVIPAVGTRTGKPKPESTNPIQFTLFVPAGTTPAAGWPVAIFGHGFTDSKNGAPWAVASSLARAGIATIAINVVGHGGGALGSYTVMRSGAAPVSLPAGGRGIDQDGNGTIDSTEGVNAAPPQTLVGNRDGLRQTVFDLLQLVEVLEQGVDVDGDGGSDLDRSRIYYAGQSFGGIYGVPLLGLERKIRAGVPNVPGGPIIEIARLSPSFRPLVGIALISRVPSLYNAVPNPTFTSFVENKPLRNLPPVVDTVPGASAIQQLNDRTEWAQQAANPAAYAPLVSRPIILQFARGDMTVPNPTTSAIIRAGGLASKTTLYRNDLAFQANPAVGRNPHGFLTNLSSAAAPFALAAQAQIATFFASDGDTVIDPDGAGPIFETPMVGPPPEDLAFLP